MPAPAPPLSTNTSAGQNGNFDAIISHLFLLDLSFYLRYSIEYTKIQKLNEIFTQPLHGHSLILAQASLTPAPKYLVRERVSNLQMTKCKLQCDSAASVDEIHARYQ